MRGVRQKVAPNAAPPAGSSHSSMGIRAPLIPGRSFDGLTRDSYEGAEEVEGQKREATALERLPTSRGCIVCGKENPIGLRVQFERTNEGVRTLVRPRIEFQGFDKVLQGGIAAGLLDDAMWYSIFAATGGITMTAELNVRYKAPIPVETDLVISGRVVEQRRQLYRCEAAIAGVDGKVLAEASGKFLTAPRSLTQRLTESMA